MNVIVPPENPHRRRRLRTRRIIFGVVAILALVGGGVAINDYRHTLAQRCPGLDDTSGEGFALSRTDEQCIGWIVERDYPFGSTDQNVVSVISKITEENRRVRDQLDTEEGKPYVRIGVLMPMTSAPDSALTPGEVLHALQGAYAAQIYANHSPSSELGDPTPLIQLVLANEGRDQNWWSGVVEQLDALKNDGHPLVAVTGLGISTPATLDAAERLSELEIPTIGAAITAEDMVAPWLFKVSSSTHQAALSLKAFLDNQPNARTGYLIYDRNPEDSYARSLKDAFIDTFEDTYGLREHSGGFNGSKPPEAGTPILFSEIVRDVCELDVDVVFYAGRSRDLPALISALKGRGRCDNPVRPLTIVSRGIGVNFTTESFDETLGMLLASSTDAQGWRTGAPGTPAHYDAFHTLFTTAADKGGLGFTEADLNDGYAIMHRDAVIAAVWAAHRDAEAKVALNNQGISPPISDLPAARDVRNALFFGDREDPIPGASGAIYFKEQPPNDRWPSGKPVPIIRLGALVEQWTSPDAYVTDHSPRLQTE